MDPLSITTGIMTCIGAAVATAKAVEKTKQFVKLPKEFNALFEEVSDLQVTLQQCQQVDIINSKESIREWCQESDKSNLLNLDTHVAKAQLKLQELEGLLKDRRTGLGIRSQEQLKATWFCLVKGTSRLDRFRHDLREVRMGLFTALNIFTSSAVQSIETTVKDIAVNTSQLATNQQQLMKAIHGWRQELFVATPEFNLPSYEDSAGVGFKSERYHHLNNALVYLSQFRVKFSGDQHVYDGFKQVVDDFEHQAAEPPAVISTISALFEGYPDLLKGFNSFLPPQDRIKVGSETTFSEHHDVKRLSASAFASNPSGGGRRRSSKTAEVRLAESRAMFKASYTETGQCVPWCSCQCHTPVAIYSPRAFKEVIGTLNVTHSGLPYLTRNCNQKKCIQRAKPHLRLSYKPPRGVADRMFNLSMSAETLGGPEVKVKLPRIVGWNSPLWLYAREGNMDAVLSLFRSGLASPWDVNSFGSNLLAYSTQTWNPEFCRRLIQYGVDPTIEDDFKGSAAMYAWDRVLNGKLSGEDAEIVSTLFEDVDYISSCCFTTIHKIVFGMIDKDLEEELECSTAEINVPDSRGRTPVSWAAARGDEKAVKLLIDAGADVNITDWRDEAPLHYARNVDVGKLLVEAGANIMAPNMDGQTPLYRIAKKATNEKLVKYLLECGVSANIQDKALQTPLDGACSTTWYLPVVNVLLDMGADINIKNDSDDTSLRFAIIYNSHAILRRMLEPRFNADFAGINNYGQSFAHAIARTADVETIDILAEAAPRSLTIDLTLRDASQKTCMDYLEERLEYLEETIEIREAWMRMTEALEGNVLPVNVNKIEKIAEILDVSCRIEELSDEGTECEFHDATDKF